MHVISNTGGVQNAARQFCLRRELRVSGALMAVFGALALLGGLAPPADLPLLCVGVVLFAAAITNIAMPSPVGIGLSGLAMGLVGLYNIVSTVLAAGSEGAGPSGAWPVIGAWQIVWGGQAIARFRRYPALTEPAPSDAEFAQAGEWVRALRKANVRQEADVIEVTNRKNPFDPKRARVRMMPAQVVVLVNYGQDVRVVPADRFAIRMSPTSVNARRSTVTLQAGDFTLEGVMPHDHVGRYQQWKQAVAPARPEPMAKAA